MRKIIAGMAVSLDGFIEGPYGETEWIRFAEEASYSNEFLNGFDTIFYGRLAYEKFGVPRMEHELLPDGERKFFETISCMRKYVFSTTVRHVAGNGMVIGRNLEEEIKRIRDEDGSNIWLWGGASIIRAFEDLDLIDEYALAVHPVTLNRGKPLFDQSLRWKRLKLIGREPLGTGVIVLHYKPLSRIYSHDRSL